MVNKFSVAAFCRFYDYIYDEASKIFSENNLCQWEINQEGKPSCLVNRTKTIHNGFKLIEADGCCMETCKNPSEFTDPEIKRRRHNDKTGCTIKSIKCKLHICDTLNKLAADNEKVKMSIEKINRLRELFMKEYGELWKNIPYGVSKAMYKKHFIKIYKNKTQRKKS